MSKKIIAVVSVVLVLASVLTACGKKVTVTDDHGREYEAITDDNGEMVVNDNGDIAVAVTDSNGKYVKDENGEKQTNYIEFPENVVKGMTLETSKFKFTLPLKGWTLNNNGRFIKDKTDESVYITINVQSNLKDQDALNTFVDNTSEATEKLIEQQKTDYPNSEYKLETAKVTDKQLDAKIIEYSLKDANGTVALYSYTVYFMLNGECCIFDYAVENGKYYDSSINMLDIINANFVVK